MHDSDAVQAEVAGQEKHGETGARAFDYRVVEHDDGNMKIIGAAFVMNWLLLPAESRKGETDADLTRFNAAHGKVRGSIRSLFNEAPRSQYPVCCGCVTEIHADDRRVMGSE